MASGSSSPDFDDTPSPAPAVPWWSSSASFRFAKLLEDIHDEQVEDAEFRELCKEGMEALQATCSEVLAAPEFCVAPFDWTPDVRLEAFGSTQQGTALKTSDLDVRMSFEQFEVYGQQRQLRYLKAIQAKPGKHFKVVQLIAEAKLPVLRLRFDGRLDVDLTMGGTFTGVDGSEDRSAREEGPGVDHHVKAVLAAAKDEEAARCFVRLAKSFAKASNLVHAHGGYLSSTSWTFLAINFLQLEGCLPPCAETRSRDAVASDAELFRLWPVQLSISLLCRFFSFVEQCGSQPHKVSLLRGRCWPLRETSCSGAASHPLFVEYPSQRRSHFNIAHSLTPASWGTTVRRCRQARMALTAKEGFSRAAQEAACVAALERLFRRAAKHGGTARGAPNGAGAAEAVTTGAKRARSPEAKADEP